jgi:hypothetical protein
LPVLVHTHRQGDVPPGLLEEGMMEWERDGVIVHALEGLVWPDGTIGDLREERLEWARRLSYRHLKREGQLERYGIPLIPAYEEQDSVES